MPGSEAAGNAVMHAESATAVWTTIAASIECRAGQLFRGTSEAGRASI